MTAPSLWGQAESRMAQQALRCVLPELPPAPSGKEHGSFLWLDTSLPTFLLQRTRQVLLRLSLGNMKLQLRAGDVIWASSSCTLPGFSIQTKCWSHPSNPGDSFISPGTVTAGPGEESHSRVGCRFPKDLFSL